MQGGSVQLGSRLAEEELGGPGGQDPARESAENRGWGCGCGSVSGSRRWDRPSHCCVQLSPTSPEGQSGVFPNGVGGVI